MNHSGNLTGSDRMKGLLISDLVKILFPMRRNQVIQSNESFRKPHRIGPDEGVTDLRPGEDPLSQVKESGHPG